MKVHFTILATIGVLSLSLGCSSSPSTRGLKLKKYFAKKDTGASGQERSAIGDKGKSGDRCDRDPLKWGVVVGVNDYKNDSIIRKEVKLNTCVVNELRRIVTESGILDATDDAWPEPNNVGKQELEIALGDNKLTFETAKIGSLNDVKDSEDPESLRILYYLVQDLKCMFSSLISMHFKMKPFG